MYNIVQLRKSEDEDGLAPILDKLIRESSYVLCDIIEDCLMNDVLSLIFILESLDSFDAALQDSSICDKINELLSNDNDDVLHCSARFIAKTGNAKYLDSLLNCINKKTFAKYLVVDYLHLFPCNYYIAISNSLLKVIKDGDAVDQFHTLQAISDINKEKIIIDVKRIKPYLEDAEVLELFHTLYETR